MKVAVRRGHNSKAIGARALIIEEVEAEKVKNSIVKYLRLAGHTVIDVSPGPMDTNSDLRFGVDMANGENVDLFVSIHFNKAYSHYDGAIGTECWTIGKGKATDIANKIVNNVANLGFKNRGVKHNGFYELKKTKMPSIIVETCFVEATKDVELFKSVGYDKIGKSIAEGINGAKIEDMSVTDPIYRVKVDGVQIGAYKEPTNAIKQLEDNWGNVAKIEIERK